MSDNHSSNGQPAKARGVLYARVSEPERNGDRTERNENSASIVQQTKWAGTACPKAEIEIVAEFIDDGKRGHETAKRTKFHEMLRYCQQQNQGGEPVDVIVCWHPNRFSRADSQETSWFIWEFRKAGVEKMFTSNGWLDFTRMEDRIIFGITQDASNHKYSQDLAAASTRGKIEVAQSGRWAGGPIPYGYRARKIEVTRKGKTYWVTEELVPDPETAPIVRWLFAAYATGEVSLWYLVNDLNRRGVRPPSSGRKGASRYWNHRTLKKILSNEVYLGDLVWNRRHHGKFIGVVDLQVTAYPARRRHANDPKDFIRRTGKHEALVERATFDACQRQLVERRTRTTPIPGAGNFRLSGLLRCGHCGRTMTGWNIPVRRRKAGESTPGGPRVPRYVCASYFAHGKQACNYNAIDEGRLLDAIARKVKERFNQEFLDAFRKAAVEEAHLLTSASDGQAEQMRRRIAELDAKIRRGAQKLLDEEDPRIVAACRATIQECTDERNRLSGELTRRDRQEAERIDPGEVADECVAVVQNLREVVAAGSPAEVRAALRDIIEYVELWFNHEETPRETKCRFARGLIYIRDDTPLAHCLVLASSLGTIAPSSSSSVSTRTRTAS
jgi:site-specific DNA recombinase